MKEKRRKVFQSQKNFNLERQRPKKVNEDQAQSWALPRVLPCGEVDNNEADGQDE